MLPETKTLPPCWTMPDYPARMNSSAELGVLSMCPSSSVFNQYSITIDGTVLAVDALNQTVISPLEEAGHAEASRPVLTAISAAAGSNLIHCCFELSSAGLGHEIANVDNDRGWHMGSRNSVVICVENLPATCRASVHQYQDAGICMR